MLVPFVKFMCKFMQVNLSRSKWKKFLLFPIFLFEWLISKNSSIVRSIVQPSFIITRSSMEFLTFSPSIPQRHERNKSGFNRCIENAFFTMPRQSFDFFRTRYYIYIFIESKNSLFIYQHLYLRSLYFSFFLNFRKIR